MDFEAMHKWALKQFTRLVPHGKHFTEHLANRHLSQFLFTGHAAAPPAEPLRFCHCNGDPCTHDVHVHVQMPGLSAEDEHGQLCITDTRSVQKVEVGLRHRYFVRALRALMARVNGCPNDWRTAAVPEFVYRANSMTLKWHGEGGKLECQDTLHASDNYYKGGPWYDSVKAWHCVPTTGPARRRPEERSRCQEQRRAGPGPNEETVLDVARVRGLYWCTVPDGPQQGTVVPFMYIRWMRYFDCFPGIAVEEGARPTMMKCKALLEDWGVEGVKRDRHEYPYMLQPDEVESIVYLQNGYNSGTAGEPDFMFIDTLWDKLK